MGGQISTYQNNIAGKTLYIDIQHTHARLQSPMYIHFGNVNLPTLLGDVCCIAGYNSRVIVIMTVGAFVCIKQLESTSRGGVGGYIGTLIGKAAVSG